MVEQSTLNELVSTSGINLEDLHLPLHDLQAISPDDSCGSTYKVCGSTYSSQNPA